MKKLVVVLVAVVLVAGVFVSTRNQGVGGSWVCVNGQWQKQGNPLTPAPTTGCAANTQPQNIVIISPQPNDTAGFPLIITGRAQVFEGILEYRVKDSDGTVLAEGTGHVSSDASQMSDFSIKTSYQNPQGKNGWVEVFDYSARDGSEENLVSVPVVFGN